MQLDKDELAAVNEAYAEQVKTLFVVLVDNIVRARGKDNVETASRMETEAKNEFETGLHDLRDARMLVAGVPSKAVAVEAAGVDPAHQTEECDYCQRPLGTESEAIKTCSLTVPLTLCRSCYDAAGNTVR